MVRTALIDDAPAEHLEDQPTRRTRKPSTPAEVPSLSPEIARESLEATAYAFRRYRQGQGVPSIDYWSLPLPGREEHGQMFRDLYRHDPIAADRVARALTSMPAVGSEFLGFYLSAELGRGAFSRVYLAHQGDLANRPVVVKIAADLWGEAHTLAQLQHPNIVPVYSVHHREPFQAVCMPYQGWTTFQDILDKLNERRCRPRVWRLPAFLSSRLRKPFPQPQGRG